MGQQQLLLIVLAAIIVGLAVTLGINMFTASSTENKRDLVINECSNLATIAQQYYRKPISLGGGGRSFTGWDIPPSLTSTVNGNYSAVVTTPDNLVITGTGTELVSGGHFIEVEATVTPNDFLVTIIH